MATTVTSKGQITIPKRIRDSLGIVPGTKIEFEALPGGRVVLRRARSERPRSSPLQKLRGITKGRLSTDEIMSLTRADD